MAEGAAATADGAVKTVFLVRHAQSEQNVASARFAEGDISALIDIAAIGYDAPLSKQGESQLREASLALDGFAAQRGIALVAHSPYQRAVHTARSLFAEFPRPLVQLPPLHERTMSEFFFPFLLDRRVAQVCSWLDAREERVIALVGHGAFFARCLGPRLCSPTFPSLRPHTRPPQASCRGRTTNLPTLASPNQNHRTRHAPELRLEPRRRAELRHGAHGLPAVACTIREIRLGFTFTGLDHPSR